MSALITLTSTMTDSQAEQSKKLLNVIEDNVYSQPLDFPTHVSGSLNNIVLCTVQNMILDIEDLGWNRAQ